MILVTGAAGKTGFTIVRALADLSQPVRALVYRPEQVERVASAGAVEWTVGDMHDPLTLEEAVGDVRSIYHICPNVSPDEVGIGQAIIAAAQAAGVEQFVYHSVLHPQIEAMPNHWSKLRVEAMLIESEFAYTILQPASYMQNILPQWRSILETGAYETPYAADTLLGMVDLEDVAAVACRVLTDEDGDHDGASYELAGPEVLTPANVAAILARRLDRSVEVAEIGREAWAERARASGLGEYQVDSLVKMFAYYERFGFWGNPRALTHLLGHPPTTFDKFVERVMLVSETTRAGPSN